MKESTKTTFRRLNKAVFALALLGLSAFLHLLHYRFFKDAHHIFIYLLGDIAFVPINVLLVTLIIERLLERQRRNILIHKLNMVLGAFFSETGNMLLRQLLDFCAPETEKLAFLNIKGDWNNKQFLIAERKLAESEISFNIEMGDLESVKNSLGEKRGFLLSLLANPVLMEHDKITNMLWAVLHLTEELTARVDLKTLHARDREHLAEDMRRAFMQLLSRWLEYMKHLKSDYPFLFSLAIRTNPFNASAHAEIIT